MDRNLDGVYFRVERNGKWESVCFSDMTTEERDRYINDRPVEWWRSMAYIMADSLREIGDRFDIYRN